ncbi:metalloproteinase inhibitor 3-like isoform X2 [Centruroides sculpturatus]|uniref:metalloproteinase inhibitor 3-like isoform X2 n=1 Tax=Centruroides sculpturatus TaxID=218467 RepID=UPI000C6E194C|nr:metalloproteinase inhibitor 3-like isoform X2 [Centruroides sculpturatus]
MEEFPAFLLMLASIFTMVENGLVNTSGDSRRIITMNKASTCLVWIFRIFLIVCLIVNVANACSCMYQHPQDHYCDSDFVALVKVKQRGKSDRTLTSYHIKIKKEFKMSEKARHALSQGLIWTSNLESLCGVNLRPTRYLITGRVSGEKVWVGICNFVKEWSSLTAKQKKGFRRLYQQACHCKITKNYIHNNNTTVRPQCYWETWKSVKYDCQNLYSICAPSSHHMKECVWLKSRAYRHCMKEKRDFLYREP